MLNKNILTPLYLQVKNEIMKEIKEKKLGDNTRLHSEREYVDKFNISRLTIRKAIEELQREGYIIRIPGKGTFYTDIGNKSEFTHVISFTKDAKNRNLKSSSKLLFFDLINSPDSIKKKLKIAKNDKLFRIKRIRYADNIPIAIQDSYIIYNNCPNLNDYDLEKNSLYEILENKFKLELAYAKNILSTRISKIDEMKLFGIKKNIAVFILKQTTYLKRGTPIEYVESIFRGDKYYFKNIAIKQ